MSELYKITLVTALRHLADHNLTDDEIIQIDCFPDEGRALQHCAKEAFDGMCEWKGVANLRDDPLDQIDSSEFAYLFRLLEEQNLCLQFVDTYPSVDGDDNFRVLVLTRKRACEALETWQGTLGMVLTRKTPLRSNALAGKARPIRLATSSRPK